MTQFAFQTYTGNGSTTQYSISWTYIDSTHVKCFLDGVSTTAFSVSGSTVTFNSAPANGVVIRIERQTPLTARLVDFQDGSVLTEAELDMSANQNFFAVQEFSDDATNYIQLDTDDKYNGQSKVIKSVANPVNDNDAVNKTYLENTWLSPANKTALTTVNANISNINAVNSNQSNINSVNSNQSNINAVNSNQNNINTVSGISADVTTVAGISSDVSAVENIASNVTTVAGISSDVTTVANNNTNVTTVAGYVANINTVASAISNVNTVATDISNVNSVASNISNINSVNSNASNINSVVSNSTNINSVATNISSVNSFAERYRIGSSDPTSSNDAGDLFFNTTSNTLRFYNGTAWADIDTGIQTEADPTAIPFSLALG